MNVDYGPVPYKSQVNVHSLAYSAFDWEFKYLSFENLIYFWFQTRLYRVDECFQIDSYQSTLSHYTYWWFAIILLLGNDPDVRLK